MSIATGAMNTLLPKLWDLIYGEYKLQQGVKKEIEDLHKELEAIEVALCKVSKVPADQLDEQAKLWARDARELSYDMEYAVDIFMMKKKQGHEEPGKPFSFKGFIDRTSNLIKKVKTNHQIHNVIKDIMEEVKKVSERRDRNKIDDLADRASTVPVDPRLEAVFRKATELVGIDRPKSDLAKRLQDERSTASQQQKIISIVGFGGLGKTTLANAVLEDLKAKFDCHFFVSVSLNPDINRIFKNILSQLDEKKYAKINEAWGEERLIREIRAFLQNKRCLCVIDDVWKEAVWDTIKLALQDGSPGSKIIITTRNRAVAERAGGGFYDLQPLSDANSKNLFYRRIFDSEDGCPPDLCKVAKKILKKCGGVPLAIITIASLLANQPLQLKLWEKVNDSIGSGLGDGSLDVENMRKILILSYYDLPPHLKTCLLSLSKYPEDKKIRKDVLIWSWIAEGFITQQKQPAGTSLQEIGESYFHELINRSLIQPADIHITAHQDDQVHAFQIHDLVLELINKLSAEEGFLTMLWSDGQRASTSMVQKKIRRLAIHNDTSTYPSSEASGQLRQARSLTVFGHVNSMPPLSRFRVLRVLQLEDCSQLEDHHLKDLSKLHLLIFLRLRRLNIPQLPESIGKLELLETLDIRGAKSAVLLPMSFGNLGNLVRLLADEVKLPHGLSLGNMKSLQELVGICVDLEAIKEIGNLSVLRVFSFTCVKCTEVANVKELILQYLQRSTNLKELVIENRGFDDLDFIQHVPTGLERFMIKSGFFKTAFPGWINSSLSCLTSLSITLDEDLHILSQDLEKLAELPSLRFLRIYMWRCGGLHQQKLTIPSGVCAFRCLRELHFYSVFMFISFPPRSMPVLQRLFLVFRVGVAGNFDFGLENLPSLRHVLADVGYGSLGVPPQEVEAAIREALKNNPNHPSLNIVEVQKYAAED
ncbi:hypothetical protein ACP70R_022749 [Stipagrostis hirtigluma subsp. patula]